MNTARLSQLVQLASGRRLGYAEYGDPQGKPVLYFHGHPGSRLELSIFDGIDQAAAQRGLRLLAIDRPGIGLSDYQPRRRFSDWPRVVAEFADRLGFERFSVMTYSAGGPYGIAAALALPERLERVGLVSPPQSFALPGALDDVGPKFYWRSAQIHPLATQFLLNMARKSTALPPLEQAGLAEVDYNYIANQPGFYPRFVAATYGEVGRNGLRGPAEEARLYVRPWELPLEDLRFPIRLWGGELDRNAPPSHIRYLAGAISTSDLVMYPTEGHITLLVNHMAEILSYYAN